MSLKILHRIYFGFDGKPDPYLVYLESWQRELPDYKIMHWDATNLPLEICYFSKKMFELKDHAFLSDYFRWWVLREHGGIYLDADIEILNGSGIDQIVKDLQSSDQIHSFIGIDNKDGGWYTGHSMGTKPGSPLSKFMCEVYEGLGHVSLWRRKIFYFMSPQLTSLYFAAAGHNVDGMGTSPGLNKPVEKNGVMIYPQEYFSPLTPVMNNGVGGFLINAYTKNTVLCHHFSCSWHDLDSPYLKGRNLNVLTLDEKIKLFNKHDVSSIARPKIIRVIRRLAHVVKKFPSKFVEFIKNA